MWECERFSTTRMLKEFSNKLEKNGKSSDFLQKLRTTGSTETTAGSGRLFCVVLNFTR